MILKQKLIKAVNILLNQDEQGNLSDTLDDVRRELQKSTAFGFESIVYQPFFSLLTNYEVQSDESWLKSIRDSLQGIDPYRRSYVFQYEFDKHVDSKWQETLSSARTLHQFILDNPSSDLRQFEQYRELHRTTRRLFGDMDAIQTLSELLVATLSQTLIFLPVNGSDSNVLSKTSYSSTLPSKELTILTSERLQRANILEEQLSGKQPVYVDVHFTEFAYVLNIS